MFSGVFLCGLVPLADAEVKLWDANFGPLPDDLIAIGKTDPGGRFELKVLLVSKKNFPSALRGNFSIEKLCSGHGRELWPHFACAESVPQLQQCMGLRNKLRKNTKNVFDSRASASSSSPFPNSTTTRAKMFVSFFILLFNIFPTL